MGSLLRSWLLGTSVAASFFCADSRLFAQATAAPPAEAARHQQQDSKLKVTLIDPGQEPRQLIRFRPEVGAKQTVVMTMNIQQKMSIDGNALPTVPSPSQVITMGMEIQDVDAEGIIQVAFAYNDWTVTRSEGVSEALVANIENVVKPLVGLRGKLWVTDRGFPKKQELTIPDGVAPQMKAMLDGMKQSFEQMASPVPAEPVGEGAKWKVEQIVTTNGISIEQTVDFRLAKIDDERFMIETSITQNAQPQKVSLPGLPGGVKMDLRSLDSKGSGKLVQVSSFVLPVHSVVQLQSQSQMEIPVGAQSQKMDMDMTMKMAIKTTN